MRWRRFWKETRDRFASRRVSCRCESGQCKRDACGSRQTDLQRNDQETSIEPAELRALRERIDQLEPGVQKVVGWIHDVTARLESLIVTQQLENSFQHLSAIYPKTDTVVFVGRNIFADNIKFAFLAFAPWAIENNVSCFFLPPDDTQYKLLREHGFPVISPYLDRWSDRDVTTMLQTRVIVMCDSLRPTMWPAPLAFSLLHGARRVQLWHGISIKELGFGMVDRNGLIDPGLAEVYASAGVEDLFIGTNAIDEAQWRKWFAFHHYGDHGYPRNDVLLREPTSLDLLNVDLEVLESLREVRAAGRTIIFYAPTFRDRVGPSWLQGNGLENLIRHCSARGYALVINLHPYEQHVVVELRARYSGVLFLSPGTDAYPVLREASILLTDYSSIAFDFLLLDRPIVYDQTDHATYISGSRPLIDGYEDYRAGQCVTDSLALPEVIDAAVTAFRDPDQDPDRERRRALRTRLFSYVDGKSAERVRAAIAGTLLRK